MGEASIVSGPSSVNVDLTEHSALVTGAASGIGRACAERLSRAGAAVTVLDLDGDAAGEVAESIGGEALQADLRTTGCSTASRWTRTSSLTMRGCNMLRPWRSFRPSVSP